jgi:hypothetical protein
MNGRYYKVDYIPNKLVYVYETTKEDIKFLAFFSEKGTGMKAIKHSINKTSSKRDFKKINFTPDQKILDMIEQELKN